jgi:hypothetical protein
MNRPHYILLPVSPLFIAFSLFCAFLLNLLPWGHFIGVPDFVALVLVFWGVHQPRKVGIGTAFFLGLLMDVHDATLLGENALAYTLLSYFAIMLHRRAVVPDLDPGHARVPAAADGAVGAAAGALLRVRQIPRLVLLHRKRGGIGAVAAGDLAAAGAAAPRGGPRPHPPDLTPRRSMTEIKDNQRELQQFRLRLTVLGGLVFICFRPAAAALHLAAGRQVQRLRRKAEEPHRHRADRAEPRPDPGPQRRGPGAQLLGLHAGDHAVQAEHHAR